jgi:hypothetical protein
MEIGIFFFDIHWAMPFFFWLTTSFQSSPHAQLIGTVAQQVSMLFGHFPVAFQYL